MSFILEALLKAERERQAGGVPGLQTVHALPPRRRTRGRHWLLWLPLLTGMAWAAWLESWRYGESLETLPAGYPLAKAKPALAGYTPGTAPPADGRLPEGVAMPLPATLLAAPAPPAAVHHRFHRARLANSGKTPTVPKRAKPAQAKAVTPKSGPQRAALAKAAPPPAARKSPAAPAGQIYDIGDLPAALQATARKIAVAGFAHSEDMKGRMAIINDRAMREGDELTGGVRVERIAGDSVIFNYKGYRFRKGRQ